MKIANVYLTQTSMQKALREAEESAIIKSNRVISGHSGAPKEYKPGAVIDHLGKNGNVETRSFYGASGMKEKDITNHDHNNPKQHPFGEHGEHAHDYTWDNEKKLKNKTRRNLTEKEREENSDIL